MAEDEEDFDVPGLPKKRAKPREQVIVERAPDPPRRSSAPPPSAAPPSRAMGPLSVIGLSIVTSALVTVGTVVALSRVQPSVLSAGPAMMSAPRSLDAGVASARVPDLVRVPLENVRSIVDALHLRLIIRDPREPSALPEGTVTAQAPAPGTTLPPGSDLVVVVSSGHAPSMPATPSSAPSDAGASLAITSDSTDAGELVAVPNIVRMHVPTARARLQLSGLVLGSRRTSYDEDLAPGRILRQSPAPATRVARGTAVDIVINEE